MSMPPYQSVHENPPTMPRQPMGPGTDQRHVQEQSLLSEILRMSPNLVSQLKQELGLDGKEPSGMTFDEKRRLVEAHRQRSVAPGNHSSSNSGASASSSASTDMSAAPFTFDFIRSVAKGMDKFDPSEGSNFSPSPPDMPPALFTPGFIQSMDEFDPSFLRPDGDINFECDFGQWFNHPDDVGGALDLR